MFVVNFNEAVSLGLPDSIKFTANPDKLESAIWRAPAFGETALYDAIVTALGRFEEGSRDKKVLVVISDGADNASAHSLAQVLQMAGRSSAIIYTVGLFAPEDHDVNPKVLSRLAQTTGGEAFFPSEPGAVTEICERIAKDIRSQYTVGYDSTNSKQDGVLSVRSSNRSSARTWKAVRSHPCRLHPHGVPHRRKARGRKMRLMVKKEPLRRILRWTQLLLFAGAVALLGYCGFVVVDARIFQQRESRDLQRLLEDRASASRRALKVSPAMSPAVRLIAAHGLIGRLEIPRLGLSAVVIEGDDSKALRARSAIFPARLYRGKPGNVALTGHRDTFSGP